MSWIKLTTYLSIIIFISLVSVSLQDFGNELNSRSDINLTQKSREFIENYEAHYKAQGLATISEDTSSKKNTPIINPGNESSEQSSSNQLSFLNTQLEKIDRVWNFFETIYNIPTFLLLSLRLPVAAFNNLINIITFAMVVGLLYVGIKWARGS